MLVEQAINGLSLGGIYALIALGYSMIFGVLKFINFSHGDMCMIGGYLCLMVLNHFGIPALPAALIAVVATGLAGIAVERVAYRPLRRSGMTPTLIASLGVSVFLQNFSQIVWSPDRQPFPVLMKGQFITVAGTRVPTVRLLVLGIAVFFMVMLTLFVQRTRIGKAMQACFEDLDTAQLMGIDTDKIVRLSFGLGAGQAAIAGILLGTTYATVFPTMGSFWGTKAFAAVVLGGVGSLPGAMLGGMILGVVETLGAAFISFGYRDAIAFFVLIAALLFKPRGLMSGKAF